MTKNPRHSLALATLAGILLGSVGHPVAMAVADHSGYLALAASVGLAGAAAAMLLRGDAKSAAVVDPFPASPQTTEDDSLGCVAWRNRHRVPATFSGDAIPSIRKALGLQVSIGPAVTSPVLDLLLRIIVVHGQRPRRPKFRDAHQLLRELADIVSLDDQTRLDALLQGMMSELGPRTWAAVEAQVAEMHRRHGSRETVLMGALVDARRARGVLATGEFPWLRSRDRNLWYALNNLGRNGGHVEGLGALAHYHAEILLGRAIATPCVETAVEAVQARLYPRSAADTVDERLYPADPAAEGRLA